MVIFVELMATLGIDSLLKKSLFLNDKQKYIQ